MTSAQRGLHIVSIRALAKRATVACGMAAPFWLVSIRALAKRATCCNRHHDSHSAVSIRALAKRATVPLNFPPPLAHLFRSAPSRRERLSRCRRYKRQASVSIRALAKRATTPLAKTRSRVTVSIRALAKRATWRGSSRSGSARGFDPRPREESDHRIFDAAVAPVGFRSAPSRRERLPSDSAAPTRNAGFDPRPREESDHRIFDAAVAPIGFRSAPSRRERPQDF